MSEDRTTKKYIIIGITIIVILTILFSIPFVKYVNNPDKLRNLIDSFGPLAPIGFIILSMIQILIPFVPGEPFELLAGYMFGSIEGSLLCFVSGSIASLIIISLIKKYGTKIINIFFKEKEFEKLNFLKSKKSFILYSIIFILPGTPKDLLCYIGGLCNYDLIPLIIVTSIGRIPSIITSTIPGDAVGDKKYALAAIIYSLSILVCIVGLIIYNRIINNSKEENNNKV